MLTFVVVSGLFMMEARCDSWAVRIISMALFAAIYADYLIWS